MNAPRSLHDRLHEHVHLRDIAWLIAIAVALLALAGWGLSRLAPPPPPRKIVMSTGAPDGAYHAYATRYRAILAEYDIDLVLKPSRGAQENLERLRSRVDGVDVALVQSGLTRPEEPGLASLGSVFYEPIWIFYRDKRVLERSFELAGGKIAIGAPGSGTAELGRALAASAGLDQPPTTLVELGGLAAADALAAGAIDAAFFVSAVDGPAVTRLLATRDVRLMDMRHADAYVRRMPFLHKIVLPEGVVDMKRNVPPQTVTLVALTANLIAREELHPVAVELLLEAARRVHGGATLLHAANVFPAPLDASVPLSTDAERFYKDRPGLLRRWLPFWLAIWLERTLFILLPLAAVAVPLFAYLPKIYDWRMRGRLDHWYRELKRLEHATERGAAVDKQLERLDEIDALVNRLKVPMGYLDRLYTLRTHASYVRGVLGQRARMTTGDD
ncbi:MAG TPA: TAXI family TRAP transporter solute-binding subunit [Burkholderiaceae bacterium]|nr:TAXI family TRAP transporter solute-binding subunit [Burkholderiaceae bacterium]